MQHLTIPKAWFGSLASNATFASFGAVMQRVCILGMIVLFAKQGSAGTIGYFSLAMAIVLPINRFAGLQLPQQILADPTKRYSLSRCLMVHLIMNGLSIILLAYGVSVLGAKGPTSQIVVILAIARAFESASEVCYAFFYRCNRAHIAAILQTIRGLTSLILVGSSYVIYGDLLIAMTCMACVYAAFTCFIDVPVTKQLLEEDSNSPTPNRVSLSDVRELAIASLPLGFCALLAIGYASIPRYAISATLGIDKLGVFEALASLTIVADIVAQSISRTTASRFAQAFAEKDKTRLLRLYRNVGLFYLAIGGGSVLFVVLCGKALLTLLYSEDFAQYGMVLAALMIARTISFACAYDTLLLTMGRYHTLIIIWVMSGMVMACTAMVMVPQHGLIGMVIAIAAGNGLRCLLIHGIILRFLSCDWWTGSRPEQNVTSQTKRIAA